MIKINRRVLFPLVICTGLLLFLASFAQPALSQAVPQVAGRCEQPPVRVVSLQAIVSKASDGFSITFTAEVVDPDGKPMAKPSDKEFVIKFENGQTITDIQSTKLLSFEAWPIIDVDRNLPDEERNKVHDLFCQALEAFEVDGSKASFYLPPSLAMFFVADKHSVGPTMDRNLISNALIRIMKPLQHDVAIGTMDKQLGELVEVKRTIADLRLIALVFRANLTKTLSLSSEDPLYGKLSKMANPKDGRKPPILFLSVRKDTPDIDPDTLKMLTDTLGIKVYQFALDDLAERPSLTADDIREDAFNMFPRYTVRGKTHRLFSGEKNDIQVGLTGYEGDECYTPPVPLKLPHPRGNTIGWLKLLAVLAGLSTLTLSSPLYFWLSHYRSEAQSDR